MLKDKKKIKPLLVFLLLIDVLLAVIFFKNNYQNFDIISLEKSKEECVQKFSNSYQRQVCLSKYFEKLTNLYSPKQAMGEAIALKKQGIINECHTSAHSIGHATLVKNNFDIAKSLISCPSSCIEGCQHGVVESLMEKVKDSKQLLVSIPHICDELSNEGQKFQCIHGIGHGLRKHGEIDLSTAVSTCQSFPKDSSRNSCLDGVFMENMNTYLGLSQQDLLTKLPTICLDIEKQFGEKALYYCVRNIAEGLMSYMGGDINKAKSFCQSLPSSYINQCESSVDHEKFLDAQE